MAWLRQNWRTLLILRCESGTRPQTVRSRSMVAAPRFSLTPRASRFFAISAGDIPSFVILVISAFRITRMRTRLTGTGSLFAIRLACSRWAFRMLAMPCSVILRGALWRKPHFILCLATALLLVSTPFATSASEIALQPWPFLVLSSISSLKSTRFDPTFLPLFLGNNQGSPVEGLISSPSSLAVQLRSAWVVSTPSRTCSGSSGSLRVILRKEVYSAPGAIGLRAPSIACPGVKLGFCRGLLVLGPASCSMACCNWDRECCSGVRSLLLPFLSGPFVVAARLFRC